MIEYGLVYFPGTLVLILLFVCRFTVAQTEKGKKNLTIIIAMIVTMLIVYSMVYDLGFFDKLINLL